MVWAADHLGDILPSSSNETFTTTPSAANGEIVHGLRQHSFNAVNRLLEVIVAVCRRHKAFSGGDKNLSCIFGTTSRDQSAQTRRHRRSISGPHVDHCRVRRRSPSMCCPRRIHLVARRFLFGSCTRVTSSVDSATRRTSRRALRPCLGTSRERTVASLKN